MEEVPGDARVYISPATPLHPADARAGADRAGRGDPRPHGGGPRAAARRRPGPPARPGPRSATGRGSWGRQTATRSTPARGPTTSPPTCRRGCPGLIRAMDPAVRCGAADRRPAGQPPVPVAGGGGAGLARGRRAGPAGDRAGEPAHAAGVRQQLRARVRGPRNRRGRGRAAQAGLRRSVRREGRWQSPATVVPLIPEGGATLQLGIGGVPDAVMGSLRDARSRGPHARWCRTGWCEAVERGVGHRREQDAAPAEGRHHVRARLARGCTTGSPRTRASRPTRATTPTSRRRGVEPAAGRDQLGARRST